MHFSQLDESDADAIALFAEDIVERFPALDTLINNAGMMAPENLVQDDNAKVAEHTIVTNLLWPIRLTTAPLPH